MAAAEVARLRVRTALSPEQIVQRLLALSKRGKLAEFAAGGKNSSGAKPLFRVAAFGAMFDYELLAFVDAAADGSASSGTTLRFELQRGGRMPLIAGVILALSVFPGVLVTHSMLAVYFSWYTLSMWQTWLWYIPLTAGPIWPTWKSISRKSREAAEISAMEAVEKIVRAIGGALVTA